REAQLADGVLLSEPAPQPQAEADHGGDPRGGDGEPDGIKGHAASALGRSFLRYMASIRRVTMKPPKMLTLARVTAATPAPLAIQPSPEVSAAAAISPPTTITEEMALVTAISGVCRAGVTLQTT